MDDSIRRRRDDEPVDEAPADEVTLDTLDKMAVFDVARWRVLEMHARETLYPI